MSAKTPSFSAIIPAAGNSDRMGSSKALLRHHSGISFLGHLSKCYHTTGADPVIAVVNQSYSPAGPDPDFCRYVVNQQIDLGRSWSIKRGIESVPDGHGCFIQNVDNPFFDRGLIVEMLHALKDDSCVIPVWQGKGGHPVLIGNEIIRVIRENNTTPDFRELLKKFVRIEIPWKDPRILLNINTPKDYSRFMDEGPPGS